MRWGDDVTVGGWWCKIFFRKERTHTRPRTKSRQNSEMWRRPRKSARDTAEQEERTQQIASIIENISPSAEAMTQRSWANRPDKESSIQSSSSAELVVVNFTTKEPEHVPRTNDHAVALPCSGVGGARRGIQEIVNHHKVTLEEAETEPQPKSQW